MGEDCEVFRILKGAGMIGVWGGLEEKADEGGGEAQEEEEAENVRYGGDEHGGGYCGIEAEPPEQKGDAGACEACYHHVPKHGEAEDEPQHYIVLPDVSDKAHEDAEQDSVNDPEQELSEKEPATSITVNFAEGESSYDEGEGLGAADASLSGNYGKECGKDDELFDGGFEEADDEGGEDGGA